MHSTDFKTAIGDHNRDQPILILIIFRECRIFHPYGCSPPTVTGCTAVSGQFYLIRQKRPEYPGPANFGRWDPKKYMLF